MEQEKKQPDVRLIGLDLDGTTLTSDKVLTPHTKEVLEKCLAEGIQVLPATGRVKSGIPEYLTQIEGMRYVILSNGASVLDLKEDKVLYQNCIPWERALELFDVLETYDTEILNLSATAENGTEKKMKRTRQEMLTTGTMDYEDNTDIILPPFDTYKSNVLVSNSIEKTQHFTKPPARYTEAKLIKEMEDLGIGRPSTYAKTMETLVDRGYVKVIDKKFNPTEIGIETTNKLQEYFSNLINVKYTAKMEDDLDKIADGKMVWVNLLDSFYKEFEPMLENAFSNMEKKKAEQTGELCPECGSPLVIRKGKYGEFTACSNYPTCKYIKKEEKKVVEVCKCPKCDGVVIEKKTKRGKKFYGCSNYPRCDYATWNKPE